MKKSKWIISLGALAIFSGCANVELPTKGDILSQPIIEKIAPKKSYTIDTSLPTISNVRTIPDFISIGIEWDANYSNVIDGYNIYRSKIKDSNYTLVSEIKNRFVSHYFDTGLDSGKEYYYKIATTSKEKESAGFGFWQKTLDEFESVSMFDCISGLPKQVKIVWKPHEYAGVKEYLILRNHPTKPNTWEMVGTVDGRLSAEFIDGELESGKVYKYRILSKLYDGATSRPTLYKEAMTKKLPSDIIEINASNDKAKQIILEYNYNGEINITGYNIYRSDTPNGSYTLVGNTKHSFFADKIAEDGVKKYYIVKGVEEYGLESKGGKVIDGATLPIPATPKIESAMLVGKNVHIKWSSPDNRAVKYKIKKRKYKNFFSWEDMEYTNITGLGMEDTDIEQNTKYKYYITGYDMNDLASMESEPVEVLIELKAN